MQLKLIKDNEEIEINLPPEVLEALWTGETSLVTQYIGWDTRWGMLINSTEANTLMRDRDGRQSAGKLSVTLTEDVKADTTLFNFLPYMDRGERIKRGLTK